MRFPCGEAERERGEDERRSRTVSSVMLVRGDVLGEPEAWMACIIGQRSASVTPTRLPSPPPGEMHGEYVPGE